MVFLILALYIAILSFLVTKFAGKRKHRWIHSGYITAFLLPFLVLLIFIKIIGPVTGSGIGGAFTGFVFAGATLITGFVFLYIGYTSKNSNENQ